MTTRFDREAAEREANEIAFQFRDSHDVVADMSRAYHTDFSGIRMYEDDAAQARVNAAGTDALAQGNNIYFRYGILNGNDQASRGLVAHELAHTMQQGIVAGDVAESAPAGAEQGGFLDWIKGVFGSRRRSQYLGGEKMTDPASLAYMKAMRDRENELARQHAMENIGSIRSEAPSEQLLMESSQMMDQNVRLSDRAWDTFSNKTGNGSKVSSAYQELGHRRGGDMQTLDRQIRASVLAGTADNYNNYLTAMENNGTDFRKMKADLQDVVVKGKTYQINDAVTGMTGDIYSILEQYLTSENGLDYVQHITGGVGNAKVFQDKEQNKETPLDYAMYTVLTGEGASVMRGMRNRERINQTGENEVARNLIAQSANKMLMIAPQMAGMSDEERASMPASLQTLFVQYNDIKRRIADALAARAGQSAQGATA